MFIRTPVFEEGELKDVQSHFFGLSSVARERLKGRRFLVTGAGTGFGQAISLGLVAMGASVILVGRRAEKLEYTRSLCHKTNAQVNIDVCPLDITNINDVEDFCRSSNVYSLDGIVHSAAYPGYSKLESPMTQGSTTEWLAMIGTNAMAPWYLTQQLIPLMNKGKRARVLFLGSEAGWSGTYNLGLYNVSKAALNNVCQSLAQEWQLLFPNVDVQVNLLVPGEARTEMNTQSTVSPATCVSMALILLSQPSGGPNGYFFHRDGRHFSYAYTKQYPEPLNT